MDEDCWLSFTVPQKGLDGWPFLKRVVGVSTNGWGPSALKFDNSSDLPHRKKKQESPKKKIDLKVAFLKKCHFKPQSSLGWQAKQVRQLRLPMGLARSYVCGQTIAWWTGNWIWINPCQQRNSKIWSLHSSTAQVVRAFPVFVVICPLP